MMRYSTQDEKDLHMTMWYEDLEKKYLHLFECVNDEESIIHNQPIRGIEVSEGWKRVVENLLERLEWIRTHNLGTSGVPWDIKLFQIKQKFGELRAYARSDSPNPTIHEQIACAIAKAEAEATLTCEKCGRIGDVDGKPLTPTKGYISFMCTPCKGNKK